ncbi:amidohydrolase family protein [Vulcaniibacterium thermophilum]|uniref:Amidohydrolase-related domain-containing protein n=1 Tax=Vulcaniibacterium thermophilum TaxID=1169913 RepID=A0A918Z0Y3_9GAMM|nr:amidohydrolase family protein [Vulcaniibacterium thermophilum]GHE32961.1 hypothetical protein GCM10007167_13770 [Vulcaniibacterium thermophilum]
MRTFSRTRTRLLATYALVAGTLALQPLAPAYAETAISLDNVRILDPERGTTSVARCIRIEGQRIAAITAAGARRCLRDADRLDAEGRFAVPGFIDMHAHLTLGPLELRRERGELRMIAGADDDIARHNAQRLVAFGVTSVRNPGGDLQAAARYATWRSQSDAVGPESFDAGPVIHNAPIEGLSVAVRTPEEMREVVAGQVAQGADWIKLYTGLSPTLLKAGIDAAHAHGRPAVAHLDEVPWTAALPMGLDGIVHLMPTSPELLPDEERQAWQSERRPGTFAFFEWWEHFNPDGPEADRLVEAFDRHRPVFDATLVAFHAAFVQDRDGAYKDDARRYAHSRLHASWKGWFTFALGWEAADFERARAIWPKVQRLAQRLYGTRARVTVGTDMSNPWIAPGISMHREMELLAESGVPTARVLQAATANAADALGIGDRVGRIRRGYEADLVLLERNPLDDIRHTRSIHTVVIDGRVLPPAQLAILKGETP